MAFEIQNPEDERLFLAYTTLRAGAEQIVATMQTIEQAAPGTFGIPVAELPPAGP